MFCSLRLVLAVALVAFSVSGCAHSDLEVADHAIPPSARMIDEARVQFTEGNYGKAVDAYAKTVEVDPTNPDAWLGLAASYDKVGRFDQADIAYGKAQDLVGATPSILNNMGYSYLLRGNLEQSRKTLEAARSADPDNPYILNNIEILNDRLAGLGKSEAIQ